MKVVFASTCNSYFFGAELPLTQQHDFSIVKDDAWPASFARNKRSMGDSGDRISVNPLTSSLHNNVRTRDETTIFVILYFTVCFDTLHYAKSKAGKY